MQQNVLIELGLPVSLMIIMAGMGLTLTPSDFRRVVVYPRAMIVGSIAQIVLIPALAFALVELLNLSPAIGVGLVVIAACPGGTTSNVFTFLARANLALSIVLTVLASLITIFTIPIFTNAALELYADSSVNAAVQLPVAQTVVTLFGIIVVPVIVGMVIRAKRPAFAKRSEKWVSQFGVAVLAVLILVIVFQTRDQILSLLAQAGPSAVALNVAGIGLGLLCGKLFRLQFDETLTIAIEVGIKNGTIGLLVTMTLLKSAEMAIPSAVYGVLMFAFGGLLVVYGRRRTQSNPAPEQPA